METANQLLWREVVRETRKYGQPRTRQSLRRQAVAFLTSWAAALVLGLGVATLAGELAVANYRVDRLSSQVRALEATDSQLEARVQALASPARLAALQGRFHLRPPQTVVVLNWPLGPARAPAPPSPSPWAGLERIVRVLAKVRASL